MMITILYTIIEQATFLELVCFWLWSIFILIYIFANHYDKRHNMQLATKDNLKKRTYYYHVWVVGIVTIFIRYIMTNDFPHIAESSEFLSIGGLLLGIIGLAFAFYARIELNGTFAFNIHDSDQHKLITTGIYRYVKHPIYTGQALMLLSSAFLFNYWYVLFLGLAAILINVWRAKKESAFLRGKFGESYIIYEEKTFF